MVSDSGETKYSKALELVLHAESRNDQKALELFLEALKEGLSPKDQAMAYLFIGSIYTNNEFVKDIEKAIEYYEKAFSLEQTTYVEKQNEFWSESKHKYGILLMLRAKLDDRSEAEIIQIYQDIIKKCDHPMVHQKIGALYASNGEYENAKSHWQYILDNQNKFRNFPNIEEYINYANENLKKLEEVKKLEESSGTKKSGCFIATAVYGDVKALEVAYLRQYRDTVLNSTKIGRAFIEFYYFISPPIAAIIKHSNLLKTVIKRFILDPFVSFVRGHNSKL